MGEKSNAEYAVDVLLGLVVLVDQVSLAISRVSKTIRAARSEGRDLSEEELDALLVDRRTALDQWRTFVESREGWKGNE